MTFKPKILKPGKSKNGYPKVVLTKNCDKKQKYVHTLVLEAFKCPRPKGKEALHGDGVRSNCALLNLRWGTTQENALDRIRHEKENRKMRGKSCL